MLQLLSIKKVYSGVKIRFFFYLSPFKTFIDFWIFGFIALFWIFGFIALVFKYQTALGVFQQNMVESIIQGLVSPEHREGIIHDLYFGMSVEVRCLRGCFQQQLLRGRGEISISPATSSCRD